MLQKILPLIALAALLLLGTGCGSAASAQKLTADDNNKNINVNVGDSLVIELAGNPSTGYTWETKDLDTAILEQVGEAEFKGDNPGMPGAGGTLIFTFRALQPSTTTLRLVYHRPWETDVEPVDTFTVTVTAQ